MSDIGILLDRQWSRASIADTPIFHTLEAADTPIFHAMTTAREATGSRVAQSEAYPERRKPIPSTPSTPDELPGRWAAPSPATPWPERPHTTGRHHLMTGRHHLRPPALA